MATGIKPSLQPPHEVDEKQFLHPKTTHSISYSKALQNKYTSVQSKPDATFTPFSVDCKTTLKGNPQAQSNLVFGDFESKNYCSLKPVMEYCGKKAILFQESDKLRLINKISHVLIGKFSHGRPIMSDIKSFFNSLKLKGTYNISNFDSKHMYIECDLLEDFIKIWLEKIWIVKGFQMRVFKWSVDFKPQYESPVVPVWIHLNGLPLYLFEKEALMSIANAIGTPLYISRNNLNRSNLSYASLCVELDVTKPLLDEVWIEFGKGKLDSNGQTEMKRDGFWQKLSYGSIPSYCTFCFHIGHSWESCKQRKDKGPEEYLGVCGTDLVEQHSGMQVTGVQFSCVEGSGEQICGAQSADVQNSGSGALARECNTSTLEEEVLVEDLSLEEGELVEATTYSKGLIFTHRDAGILVQRAALAGSVATSVSAASVVSDAAKVSAGAEKMQQEGVSSVQQILELGITTESVVKGKEEIMEQQTDTGTVAPVRAEAEPSETAGKTATEVLFARDAGLETDVDTGADSVPEDAAKAVAEARAEAESHGTAAESVRECGNMEVQIEKKNTGIHSVLIVAETRSNRVTGNAVVHSLEQAKEVEDKFMQGKTESWGDQAEKAEEEKLLLENTRSVVSQDEDSEEDEINGTLADLHKQVMGFKSLKEGHWVQEEVKNKNKKQDIRITSQLRPSEVKECAKKELAQVYSYPTSTFPSIINLHIPDKDGNAVPIYEIIEKSAGVSELTKQMYKIRNMDERLKGEHGLDFLRATGHYDKYVTWYTIEILQALKDHRQTSFCKDSTTDKVTPLDNEVIKQGLEWNTPERRCRDHNT